MNILLPVASFHYLTGAEMYVYELGRELIRLGHSVTVASNRVEGAMAQPAHDIGIRAYRFKNFARSQKFDLIHASEEGPTRWALAAYPRTPIFCTIHSQYPCERPVLDRRILHYICIRPEVRDKITEQDGVPVEKTSVVYNPVDFSRFKPEVGGNGSRLKKQVLFCGTIDQLRKQTIFDLIRRSQEENFILWLVGLKADNYDGYIEKLPDSVVWRDQTWGIERYVRECDETAGILLGRTTIEGWACGKPGWIYEIDLEGQIRTRALHLPPPDMERFDSRKVVSRLLAIYQSYVPALPV